MSAIGFNFVPFPRSIWDKGLDLSHSELRLWGYLARHLLGNNRNQPRQISDDELLNGIWRKNCHSRRDEGCGIKSRKALHEATEALQKRGWIEVHEDTSSRFHPQRWYSIGAGVFSDEDNDYRDDPPPPGPQLPAPELHTALVIPPPPARPQPAMVNSTPTPEPVKPELENKYSLMLARHRKEFVTPIYQFIGGDIHGTELDKWLYELIQHEEMGNTITLEAVTTAVERADRAFEERRGTGYRTITWVMNCLKDVLKEARDAQEQATKPQSLRDQYGDGYPVKSGPPQYTNVRPTPQAMREQISAQVAANAAKREAENSARYTSR